MKKTLFTMAVAVLTAIGSSQADAEMLMLNASNGGSFTFDAAGAGDSLITSNNNGSPDNGLSDVAFFLGYQTGPAFNPNPSDVVALNSGVGSVLSSNTGQFVFDTVTFDNGVSVDAVANFRLVDATPQGLGHHVVYDLELETSGVSNATEGALQSFVGFDFNGNGADAIQGNEIIAGFATSDIAIGSSDRTLVGDFTFPVGQGGALTTVAGSRTGPVEVFNGAVGGNLSNRFDSVANAFSTGNLAFGAFNDFASRDVDQIDTTAGVVGFRSSAAVIPEPSTLTMAAIGLGMVAFRRRKRA